MHFKWVVAGTTLSTCLMQLQTSIFMATMIPFNGIQTGQIQGVHHTSQDYSVQWVSGLTKVEALQNCPEEERTSAPKL